MFLFSITLKKARLSFPNLRLGQKREMIEEGNQRSGADAESSTRTEEIHVRKYFEFDESVQIPFLNELYIQIFGEKDKGLCVEVGAFDGKTCSNSIGLAMRGWQCYLIEPIKEYAERAKSEHNGRENVIVFNQAIHSFATELAIYNAGPLSTTSAELYKEYGELDWAKTNLPETPDIHTVQADTLDNFIFVHLIGQK